MSRDLFSELRENDRFCAELGRLTMSLDRLESNLRALLKSSGAGTVDSRATIRQLIPRLKAHGFLTASEVRMLGDIDFKADYLTRRLFDSSANRIDESGFLPLDVSLYTERARDLRDNLDALSVVIERRLSTGATSPFGRRGLILSP